MSQGKRKYRALDPQAWIYLLDALYGHPQRQWTEEKKAVLWVRVGVRNNPHHFSCCEYHHYYWWHYWFGKWMTGCCLQCYSSQARTQVCLRALKSLSSAQTYQHGLSSTERFPSLHQPAVPPDSILPWTPRSGNDCCSCSLLFAKTALGSTPTFYFKLTCVSIMYI